MFIEKLFWSFLDFMNLTVCSKPLPRLALLHNVFVGTEVCNFSIILENVSYLFGQAVKFAVSFLQILQLQLLFWKKRHGILWNQRNSLQCYIVRMLLEYSRADWGGYFKLTPAPLWSSPFLWQETLLQMSLSKPRNPRQTSMYYRYSTTFVR